MITPSLPQDRAALVDRDLRVTLPYRRWMSDLTKALVELQAVSSNPTDPGPTTPAPEPQTFTITGSGWIQVTGSLASGNFNVTQRAGLTTDDLAEGTDNLYFPEAPIDGTTYGRKDGAWEAVAGGGVSDGDKGDITVTVSGSVWTVDNKAITYAKLQDISATARVLGRKSSGAGVTEECTLSDVLDMVGSAADGDILYRSGGSWTRLGIGTDGYVLKVVSGAPAYAAITGFASTTQADECIAGLVVTPANGDYKIVVKAPHAGTITEVTTICASGTCTLTTKINTTALGGTANSVSSSEQSQSHSSSNAFSAGDDIVLTVSSNSGCSKLSFTIKYTRALA